MNKTAQLFHAQLEQTPADVRQRVEWSFQIADFIYSELKRRGITQKEFAKQMHCSEAEVSRWVGGTHNFTLSTLAKIATVLGSEIIKVPK